MGGLAIRNDGPITLVAGEALAADRFVKISGSTVVYADAGEVPIGVTMEAVASGANVPIDLLNGIRRVTAAKALSAGGAIYVANDGKASDAAVGKQLGINIWAATGSGGIVPVVFGIQIGGSGVFSSSHSVFHYRDDFTSYNNVTATGDYEVTEDAGAGTGDCLDETLPYGILNVGCDGDDNDECYVGSRIFGKFTTTKKLFFETYIKLTEANTDDANLCIGLCSVYAADTLVNNGAGMVTTYDGAMFYKVDGTMTIKFLVSNGAVQNTPQSMGTFTSGTWYRLGFEYDYNDGTTAKVTPYLDGVAGTAESVTISGLDALLRVVMGVKAGGTNEENMKVDYIDVWMER